MSKSLQVVPLCIFNSYFRSLNSEPNSSEKWFIYLTNHKISDDIQILLNLGGLFNPPCQRNFLLLENMLTDVEYIVGGIPEESRSENKSFQLF